MCNFQCQDGIRKAYRKAEISRRYPEGNFVGFLIFRQKNPHNNASFLKNRRCPEGIPKIILCPGSGFICISKWHCFSVQVSALAPHALVPYWPGAPFALDASRWGSGAPPRPRNHVSWSGDGLFAPLSADIQLSVCRSFWFECCLPLALRRRGLIRLSSCVPSSLLQNIGVSSVREPMNRVC